MPGALPITVSATRCIGAWTAPNPGRTVFAIVNRASRPGTVYLFHPVSGAIVATTRVSASTTSRLRVTLRPGVYMWGCALRGMPVRSSESSIVPIDPAAGRPSPTRIAPLTPDQLAGPIRAYRRYADGRLHAVETRLATLRAQLAAGDLAAAKGAFLAAHVSWRELGGAYDAFGPVGQQIDGGTGGFPRIERDLWGGHRRAALRDTGALARDIEQLRAAVPRMPIAASELPLRSHEILEDSLRDELTGDAPDVSATTLASVEGDVTATRELLGVLAPLIAPRAPLLVARARAELRRIDTALAASRTDGRWIAVDRLPTRRREQIDGSVGAAVETLSAVPGLLAIGRT